MTTARRRSAKPIDVGNGRVCASFGEAGQWLSQGTLHAAHGFVELSGLPPFDERWRGHPDAVRRYRTWMTEPRFAFLTIDAPGATHSWTADAPAGALTIVQRVKVHRASPGGPTGIRLRFRGRLDRPALAEITETDPPSPTGVRTDLRARGATLIVRTPGLPAGARVSVEVADPSGMTGAWSVEQGEARYELPWPPGSEDARLTVRCSLRAPTLEPMMPGPRRRDPRPVRRLAAATPHVPDRLRPDVERMRKGAIRYVRDCSALRVTSGERVILTDHRILPLSWTRDAYWQARLLLATGGTTDATIVADHLRWLFLRCDRPDGAWVRSHHANGRRKDLPWQADQQLYPLLELTDLIDVTGHLPVLPARRSWAAIVSEAWAPVERAIDETVGLLRTAENPADDPTGLPFLMSVQVLVWHCAVRLAASASVLGMVGTSWHRTAERVRAAATRHFPVPGPFGRQWAYAVDGRGSVERYADANDLPTACAPLWGFTSPDDPVWQATMRFAFDPANPGYAAGTFDGLGSRHTPGPWTLGDIQRWLAASLAGDIEAAEAALQRLVTVAQPDGMLPETYDPANGRAMARPWFAWPGAALASLLPSPGRSREPIG